MAGVAAFLRQHALIGIDTAAFIYYYERTLRYLPVTRLLFRGLATGVIAGVTSPVTLTELTVRPLALGQRQLVNLYTAVLSQHPHMLIQDITLSTARMAAELRARHGVRTIDALQLATALGAGATGFVTNDRRLSRVTELDVLVLEDTEEVQRMP
ncbi:MAG: type II toxin-antitoxin system VapC family toxin [Acidimicrobiia bacterium]